MSAESFKNLNERDFRLWSFFVSITDKQQIFWKRSSRIFIILLFLLKFSRAFEIISCSFANLWFITRFAFYDLTAIIQLRNVLIHFIRTIIFRNIFYALTVTKRESHIIEDVIAISCNLTFSSLSIETKCISLLETREKIMQWMLCLTRSARMLKSIETINFYDDEYEFLNVRRWRITFSFLIDSEYFNIFNFNEFVNVLSFIFFDMLFFQLDIILHISDLLSISNLIFYFSDCATYHICVIKSKQLSFLTILFWLQFCVIHIKKEKRWWRKYIKDLWDRQIENDSRCIEICIFDYCNSVIVLLFRIIH